MKHLRGFGIAALLLLASCNLQCFAFAGAPVGQLPESVRPLHYDLTLTILPHTERFSGVARIEIRILQRCSSFWIHGRGLRVHRASLMLEDGSVIRVDYRQEHEDGVARIRAGRELDPQKAYLYLGYDAPFDEQLLGLYRIEEDSRWYAFTQFQSIFARQCFPSFDEPAFRAPFDITMIVRAEDAAISNTLPIAETILPNGLKQVRFAQTQPLPTYLVAFAVGPFDVVKAPDLAPGTIARRPIPFRGIAARGKGEKLQYALSRTPELFQRLEEYFGIAYPFDKLDIIAVPDFDYGAMENAGAITFDEYGLLLDGENAPVEQVRDFALTMTHELSHQWFGNLVTIRWWDDLWLNESFATWMEHRIVQEWAPEHRSDLAALESTITAMRVDSLEAANPLRQPVERGADAEGLFDVIAYAKGGAVLAMFESFVGRDSFQKGVRAFLEKRRYSSATAGEFLADFAEATHPAVRAAFETFLFQAGVPVIETDIQCGERLALALFRQSRYRPLGSDGKDDAKWEIPVCVQYDRQEAPHTKCILMSGRDAVLELEGAPCPAWVLPNAEGAGYYRWSLPARWNEKVVAAPLSLTGRLNVADNVRAAFTAGRISAEDAIRSLAPFASADERAIATVPMEVLRFAGERLVPEDLSAAGRSYSAGLYGDVYRRLGFDPRPGEDDDTRLLRRDVIEFLALEAMDPDVRKEADARGRALAGYPAGGRLDPGAVDENLAEVSLSVALQVNGKPFLNALVDLLGKTTDTIERDHILSAIGSSTDPVLAPDVLALTFHRALRVSESVLPVFYQVRHPETRAQAWQWFRTNFDRLMRRIPASERAFLPLAARRFCSDAEAEEVRRFFEPRMPQLPGASATLAESLESIRLCAARVRAQSESARNFFLSPQ